MKILDVPEAKLREACRSAVKRNGATLWGRAFDVSDDTGQDLAAEFLTGAVMAVMANLIEGEVRGS